MKSCQVMDFPQCIDVSLDGVQVVDIVLHSVTVQLIVKIHASQAGSICQERAYTM